MKRYGSLLCGAVAAVSVYGVLAAQTSIASDRVLSTMPFDHLPSLVLADAPAQRLVAFTDADRWAQGGGSGSLAEAHVLDENGQVLNTVPIGPRPSQALVDPRTGHIFVLTAGVPGATAGFFSTGLYLSVLDPRHAVVLHTSLVQSPQASGGAFGGGRPTFGGGRPPFSAAARPPAWLMSYRSISSLNSGGVLALDSAHRRLFVASGGGGGGFFSGGGAFVNGPTQISMLNADSFAVLRTLQLPVGVTAMAVDPQLGRLFVVDRTGILRILDVHTLKQLSSRHVSGGAAQLAVDTRAGRVLVLDTVAGTVTTVDSTRGTVVAVASVDPDASGIQVDEHTGHVFVESIGTSGFGLERAGPGSVSMLDAAGGRLLRTIPVGSLPFGAALDATHHRLFVSSFDSTAIGSGRVQVLDTANGTLLRTIVVPTSPFSITVDARQEHLAVTGLSGSDAQSSSGWMNAIDDMRQLLKAATPAPTPAAPQGGLALQGGMYAQSAVSVVQAGN